MIQRLAPHDDATRYIRTNATALGALQCRNCVCTFAGVIAATCVLGFNATARADFVIDTSFLGGDQLHITTAVTNSTSYTGDVNGTANVGIKTIGASQTGSGFATIKPDGSPGGPILPLTSLTFDPVDDTFSNFNFRGQLFQAPQDITVTVNDNLAASKCLTFTISKANQDFASLGVIAVAGTNEFIDSVNISTGGQGFKEVKQIQFGTEVTAAVPEPSTWAMMMFRLLSGSASWPTADARLEATPSVWSDMEEEV